MPAWPGGPCPDCGESMPENMIHCRTCRALLNTDLEQESVQIPVFVPLPEIDSFVEMAPRGYYIACPHCTRELRVSYKYKDARVVCNACAGKFELNPGKGKLTILGYYAECPHCTQRVRMATKYAGMKVACKFCQGRVMLVIQ